MSNEEYRASGPPGLSHEHRAMSGSGRQAAQQVSRLMTEQKNRAADGLHRLAGALRERTHHLGQIGARGRIATSADRAAAGIDSASTYVRGADFPTMFRDAGRLARRRPEVLLAGGFVAGLFLGRYLKASRRDAGGLWTSADRWHEALERGTKIVSEAADAVKQGIEARGLSPESVVQKIAGSQLAKHVAVAGNRQWRKWS